MDWVNIGIGAISAMFAYFLFTSDNNKDTTDHTEDAVSDIEINDYSGRHVTLSCQTCRKLKRHKEIEPNMYQCVKCKRHVDLRVS